MPRQARLDSPGTLHHVIIRGLERGTIVRDDADREAFVTRLGDLAQATGTAIYAWAVLPNHAHLLVRSGPAGLPRFMRRLLTGYAVTFNRRHQRVGYLFQNRYKSIVCEEDAYSRNSCATSTSIRCGRGKSKPSGRSSATAGVGTPRSSAGGRGRGKIAGPCWHGSVRRSARPYTATARSCARGWRWGADPSWWAVAC